MTLAQPTLHPVESELRKARRITKAQRPVLVALAPLARRARVTFVSSRRIEVGAARVFTGEAW